MNKLTSYRSLNTDLAALFLRVIFGGMFVRYGYQKIAAYEQILPMFGDIIGIGAKLSFHLVIFAEAFCGFFVLVGFLTRLSVIPVFITMLVAFFIAHAKDPFDVKQVAFLYLLLCIPIFILGSGRISVDKILFRNKLKGGRCSFFCTHLLFAGINFHSVFQLIRSCVKSSHLLFSQLLALYSVTGTSKQSRTTCIDETKATESRPGSSTWYGGNG